MLDGEAVKEEKENPEPMVVKATVWEGGRRNCQGMGQGRRLAAAATAAEARAAVADNGMAWDPSWALGLPTAIDGKCTIGARDDTGIIVSAAALIIPLCRRRVYRLHSQVHGDVPPIVSKINSVLGAGGASQNILSCRVNPTAAAVQLNTSCFT